MTRLGRWLALDRQRGSLFLWVPVCLGCGIGLYFLLPVEPDRRDWLLLAGAIGAGAVALAAGLWHWPLFGGLLLVGIGVGLAGLRTDMVAGPTLDFRYYGAVQGRIVTIDRSASEKTRLTLDRVVLERTDPARVPLRVRVSLHGAQDWIDPKPGQTVILTAHLSAPEGPVEPGGFDFRRMAWFDRIGAVGYTRTPALLIADAPDGQIVARLRTRIGAYIRATLPGETGAVATALTTGDRSYIGAVTMETLRASNLAHLLAISGLHMGLLTGVVFGALRLVLVAVPRVALRWPTKCLAAVGALAAAAFYLALSGGNVATQRAFVMVAVMLTAILLGRRAVTLRAVAVAAVIVLCLRPEALTEPGFQMSFAATTALVAVFRWLRGIPGLPRRGILGWIVALIISSAVAGAATAPFSAAHFNQIAQYGLLANLLSVPVMGVLVMPAAVLSAVLAPIGGAWIGLWLMAIGIDWILGVAHWVAGLGGAVIAVPAPGPAALPLLAVGGLMVMAWNGVGRWVGVIPLAAAAGLWMVHDRPALLIDPGGSLVGIMGPEGRVLSKPRGAGFAARVWLENDGDSADQPTAAARQGWVDNTFAFAGQTVHHVYGRGWEARARAMCTEQTIVVTTGDLAGTGPCLMFDETTLARTGAVAISRQHSGIRIKTAIGEASRRPWTGYKSPDQAIRGEEVGDRIAAAMP